jgi:hypothetical protein
MRRHRGDGEPDPTNASFLVPERYVESRPAITRSRHTSYTGTRREPGDNVINGLRFFHGSILTGPAGDLLVREKIVLGWTFFNKTKRE